MKKRGREKRISLAYFNYYFLFHYCYLSILLYKQKKNEKRKVKKKSHVSLIDLEY